MIDLLYVAMCYIAFVTLCAVLKFFALLKTYYREENYEATIEKKNLPLAIIIAVVNCLVMGYLTWLYFFA
jgi:hypothetical protein